jgi:hypothetical protein
MFGEAPLRKGVTRVRWPIALEPRGFAEDYAMTIEIIYLTARIHHWLNVRVARHLAAQAERLAR